MEGKTRRKFIYAGAVVCIAGVAGCTGEQSGDGGDGGQNGNGGGGNETPAQNGDGTPEGEETGNQGESGQQGNAGELTEELRKKVHDKYENGELKSIVEADLLIKDDGKHLFEWSRIGTTGSGGDKWKMTVEYTMNPEAPDADSFSHYKDNRKELSYDLTRSHSKVLYQLVPALFAPHVSEEAAEKYEVLLHGFLPSDQRPPEDRVSEVEVRYHYDDGSESGDIYHEARTEAVWDMWAQASEEGGPKLSGAKDKFKRLLAKELRDPQDGFQFAG